MKEEWVDKKAELLNMLNCIEGNHLVDCDEKATKYTGKCCDAIRKLIEDTQAYDERIDEIVEYYRRQEQSGVDEGKDETIVEVWLEKNWNEDWCHSDDYEEMVKWLRKFKKQLLSQKPQDYEQNLTDCTEAIDTLIEERDALIEDLEQKRVVTITRCDEDALFEGSPKSFHERLVKMLKEKGVEVK